jgi:probable F420-dependent oxidoreductase
MKIDAATVSKKCEALGFESMFIPEHPIIPVDYKTPYPLGDGKIPEPYAHMPDPFVLLAFAACATERLKIGSGICLVPERDPIVLAKEVATLDYYSGGRFLFGIGAGWLADETEIMGVEFKKRWEVTQEYVMAMKALWTEAEPSFAGEYVRFPKVKSYPKPVQKPHPPIHLERAA